MELKLGNLDVLAPLDNRLCGLSCSKGIPVGVVGPDREEENSSLEVMSNGAFVQHNEYVWRIRGDLIVSVYYLKFLPPLL